MANGEAIQNSKLSDTKVYEPHTSPPRNRRWEMVNKDFFEAEVLGHPFVFSFVKPNQVFFLLSSLELSDAQMSVSLKYEPSSGSFHIFAK